MKSYTFHLRWGRAFSQTSHLSSWSSSWRPKFPFPPHRLAQAGARSRFVILGTWANLRINSKHRFVSASSVWTSSRKLESLFSQMRRTLSITTRKRFVFANSNIENCFIIAPECLARAGVEISHKYCLQAENHPCAEIWYWWIWYFKERNTSRQKNPKVTAHQLKKLAWKR